MVRGRAGPCIPGRAYVIQPDSASAPGHIGNLTNGLTSGLSGKITLRRGKTVIGTGSIASQPTFKVPATAAVYTLSATAKLKVPWSTLGTSAQATWTFRSRHVSGTSTATLPLWDVRISGAFNALDEVPADKPFRLVIAPDPGPREPEGADHRDHCPGLLQRRENLAPPCPPPSRPGQMDYHRHTAQGNRLIPNGPEVPPPRPSFSVAGKPLSSMATVWLAGMALAPHPPHGRAWAHASGSRVPSTAA
jgi:hypothetical protein